MQMTGGSLDILGATGFNFDFENFKSILGGVIGLFLLIGFVAALGGIVWEFFVARNSGGADMSAIWKYVTGIIIVIVFSLIWSAVFGPEFLVDATSDGFDGIQGGTGN